MGNAASCTPLAISSSNFKVLRMDGTLEVYSRPMKAGEFMVENPGHFLCNSSSLKAGQRIHGVAADENLELRQLYFLLPMELLYSVLTCEEMSALSYRASKATRHGSGFNSLGKIFPVCIFISGGSSSMNSIDGDDGGVEEEGPVRFVRQRSWKPALESIAETCERKA